MWWKVAASDQLPVGDVSQGRKRPTSESRTICTAIRPAKGPSPARNHASLLPLPVKSTAPAARISWATGSPWLSVNGENWTFVGSDGNAKTLYDRSSFS